MIGVTLVGAASEITPFAFWPIRGSTFLIIIIKIVFHPTIDTLSNQPSQLKEELSHLSIQQNLYDEEEPMLPGEHTPQATLLFSYRPCFKLLLFESGLNHLRMPERETHDSLAQRTRTYEQQELQDHCSEESSNFCGYCREIHKVDRAPARHGWYRCELHSGI